MGVSEGRGTAANKRRERAAKADGGTARALTLQLGLAPVQLLLAADLLQLLLVGRGHKLLLVGKLVVLGLALALQLRGSSLLLDEGGQAGW